MANKNLYDVVIVGGGPAGLTAALYLARAQYRVLVVEKDKFGGQITITHEVVNYPGVFNTSGAELTEVMRKQAESFGAEFMMAEVTGFSLEGDVKVVRTSRGDLECFGILLATGANPCTLGFPGEEEFKGRGVAYCATCDGEFFTGKDVFVIGGGFAAAEESVFLTKYAKHVYILIRRDEFSCATAAYEPVYKNEKITVIKNSEIQEVSGDASLNYLRYVNNKTNEVTEHRCGEGDTFGVFVFAGYKPVTDLVEGIAELDPKGYIITNEQQQTSVEGLYAAGDVCVKNLRQVVTATGQAAQAATEMERYCASMQEKTGLVPEFRAPQVKAAPSQESAPASPGKTDELFTPEIVAQLEAVFGRMENNLSLKVVLDNRPSSQELLAYMKGLDERTEKISLTVETVDEQHLLASQAPFVDVCYEDGESTGLRFHGVPGGHEFTSFVLGLYNASGPGQPIDAGTLSQIKGIDQPVSIQVLVSLSCMMCPDTVIATQRIASENKLIEADVFDVMLFPDIKERYNVMSVPCVVVNDGETVSFGKKNVDQLLEILKG